MNYSKNTHDSILQNETAVKATKKHDANLQKNTTLYFQMGLILCLLAVFGLFEMQFKTTVKPIDYDVAYTDPLDEVPIENFKVYKEPKPEVQIEIKRKVQINNNFKEVDDAYIEKKIFEPNKQVAHKSTPLAPETLPDFNEPEEEVNVSFHYIQVVPIYPGCENQKSNDAKRKCMSEKISKLVRKKFNTDIGIENGLRGKQVIQTEFKIDKTGRITEIKTRASHPALQNEAERVINKIPEMIPGKQNNKNVGVIYTLPIVFQALD